MTGCRAPSAAAPAGNIILNLQQKWCQWPPAILIEPLQCRQNAFLSNPASSMGTKKKKVTRSVGQIGGVVHNHHFVFSQELLDAEGCVCRALSWCKHQSPVCHFSGYFHWMLSCSCSNTFIKLLIFCLSWRNKLPVHYPSNIKKRNQHCLDTWGGVCANLVTSTDWLLLWLRVVVIALTLITCYNFYEKLSVVFEPFLQVTGNIHLLVFCSSVSRRGMYFATTCFIIKYSIQVCLNELHDTPVIREIPSMIQMTLCKDSLVNFFNTFCEFCLWKGGHNTVGLQQTFHLFWND